MAPRLHILQVTRALVGGKWPQFEAAVDAAAKHLIAHQLQHLACVRFASALFFHGECGGSRVSDFGEFKFEKVDRNSTWFWQLVGPVVHLVHGPETTCCDRSIAIEAASAGYTVHRATECKIKERVVEVHVHVGWAGDEPDTDVSVLRDWLKTNCFTPGLIPKKTMRRFGINHGPMVVREGTDGVVRFSEVPDMADATRTMICVNRDVDRLLLLQGDGVPGEIMAFHNEHAGKFCWTRDGKAFVIVGAEVLQKTYWVWLWPEGTEGTGGAVEALPIDELRHGTTGKVDLPASTTGLWHVLQGAVQPFSYRRCNKYLDENEINGPRFVPPSQKRTPRHTSSAPPPKRRRPTTTTTASVATASLATKATKATKATAIRATKVTKVTTTTATNTVDPMYYASAYDADGIEPCTDESLLNCKMPTDEQDLLERNVVQQSFALDFSESPHHYWMWG